MSHGVLKREMKPSHKLLFEFVNKCLFPHTEHRHEATYRYLGLMESLDTNQRVNLPELMIKHMARVVDPERSAHGLSYGFLLTQLFEAHQVLFVGKVVSKKELFD